MKFINPIIVERCLLLARDGSYFNCLVRLPKAIKVGPQFCFRLADLAESYTHGRCWRIWIPKATQDALFRHYILTDQVDFAAGFLTSVAKALSHLNVLPHAEVFIPDVGDGFLRRVFTPVRGLETARLAEGGVR